MKTFCHACDEPKEMAAGGIGYWHLFHLLVTILLVGLWLPIWIVHAIIGWCNKPKCPDCGTRA